MRVLMISKAFVVGIYQRKLEALARQPNMELTVVVPPSWNDSSGTLHLEKAYTNGYDLRVEPIRFNGNFHLHYYPTLPQLLREVQPEIVHIDEEPYNLATWHALWHTRRMLAASEPPPKTLFFTWQNIFRRYPWPFSAGEAWTLRHIDYVIAGTTSAAEVWRAKDYQGPLAVIPQVGVDTATFHPVERAANPTPIIGYIGRLVPEKGIDLLLRALATIKDLPWKLHIIGQGTERANLEQLALQLGIATQVWFAGHMPSTQMAAVYPQLDMLVVPSRTRPNWKEQFGRVVIEAMACGVPVIGSNSAFLPDVIGKAGLIFPEDNLHVLAQTIRGLLSTPSLGQELGRLGRNRVLAHYTHEQIAGYTLDVYHKMLY